MNGNGNNNNGWDEWLERYQHDQELQNQNIGQLTKDVAELTATVRTLVENQRGLFSRANRPMNWGAILTAIGMAAAFVTLIVTPMKMESSRQHNFDLRIMEHLVTDAKANGRNENDLKWLKMLEQRYNSRIHHDPK